MRTALEIFSVICLVGGAIGCASTGSDSAPPSSAAPLAATAPTEPAAATTAAPVVPAISSAAEEFKALAGADQGVLVFFRPKTFVGAAVRFKVREGETELGKLSSGTYFAVPLAAGVHEFNVHSEAKDRLRIEVAPGDVYFVSGTVTMGVMIGRPNLAPSDAATFESMQSKLKSSAVAKP